MVNYEMSKENIKLKIKIKMVTLDEKINMNLSESISKFLLSNDDPEELIILNTEEEKEIYELKIGENQSTSK